jgi:hypothetical protein
MRAPMIPVNKLSTSGIDEHWHKCADEARSVADDMKDEISKQMMLQIADDYERLAKRAERPNANPKPGRPSGPRLRYQRSYSPRAVGGKVITPADLRRLRKYMLEIEKVSVISDEMRAVVETEWPELAHKLPPRR